MKARKLILGCLLLLLLPVALAAALLVTVLVTDAPPARLAERSLEERLAPAEAEPARVEPAVEPAEVGSSESAPAEPIPLPPGRPAHAVRIDFEEGDLEVAPVEGGVLRAEGHFDESAYELQVTPAGADPAVPVQVTFRRRIGWVQSLARLRLGGQVANRVRVLVPLGVPLDLAVKLRRGEAQLDLSGLALRSLAIDSAMGSTRVRFTRRSPAPLERMTLRSRMGELGVRGLGAASPRQLDVDLAMGEQHLELGREPEGPIEAHLRVRMGELAVRVPAGMPVVTTGRSVFLGEIDAPAGGLRVEEGAAERAEGRSGRPTFYCTIDVGMGEASVR